MHYLQLTVEKIKNVIEEIEGLLEGLEEAEANISDIEEFGGESYRGEDMFPTLTAESCREELACWVQELITHAQDMADQLKDPDFNEQHFNHEGET
jgi:hypothetical protein